MVSGSYGDLVVKVSLDGGEEIVAIKLSRRFFRVQGDFRRRTDWAPRAH